jgi:hypothetical protein
VGIYNRKTLSGIDILPNHRFEQCGFTCACFSDDVHVGAPVSALDAEKPPMISKVGMCEERCSVVSFSGHRHIVTF